MLTTYIAHGLPMDQEPYFVYTPPNYDPKHKGGYPVYYLCTAGLTTAAAGSPSGKANLSYSIRLFPLAVSFP